MARRAAPARGWPADGLWMAREKAARLLDRPLPGGYNIRHFPIILMAETRIARGEGLSPPPPGA
ncbi:MAG TPA: hypothetical protein DDZ83_02520 [Nitrospinae bacterium]|nr:hypothetical protein [Nitrospinota bacterium]